MTCELDQERIKFWKESAKFWIELYLEVEEKNKKLEIEVARLKDKLWWTSGGY